MRRIILFTILSQFAICATGVAEPLVKIETGLGSQDPEEREQAISELCARINDTQLNVTARVAAVELAGKMKIIECTETLIGQIATIRRRDK